MEHSKECKFSSEHPAFEDMRSRLRLNPMRDEVDGATKAEMIGDASALFFETLVLSGYVPLLPDAKRGRVHINYLRNRLELLVYEDVRSSPNHLYGTHALYLFIEKFCSEGYSLVAAD